MLNINLPAFNIKIKEEDQKQYVFDQLRKRYVVLTPEEWIRQHFIHYLTAYKHYPQQLLGNEISLKINHMQRRCDSILYDKQARPKMIIEYKAPDIKITAKTFHQICSYNLVLQVDYLIVSNGINHYCCKMNYEKHSYEFLKEVPDYSEII